MFARGDLFYIQNLVATIEAASTPPTSTSIPNPAAVADPSGIDSADVPPTAIDLIVAESCKGYWPDMSVTATLRLDPGSASWVDEWAAVIPWVSRTQTIVMHRQMKRVMADVRQMLVGALCWSLW